MKSLKVLIVAPLKRRTGTNVTAARPRLVFDLASGLVKRGHKVSILGTADSKVAGAKTIGIMPKGFIELGPFENPFDARTGFLVRQAKILKNISDDFDIIHNHSRPEFFHLLTAENIKTPMLTTIHSQAAPETVQTLSYFKNCYLAAISQSAKKAFKKTRIYKTIYNGVDTDLYKFQRKKEDYLLWLGRLGREKDKNGEFTDVKGVRWAIKLALATNSKLKLAGNVEDIDFFNKDVKPYLSKKIQWVCPISSEQPLSKKQVVKLMQNAKAFLMTINWQEPFGLVMAEAMSCGAPVIGFARGSVSELVKNNKTGLVVEPSKGITGLKQALKNIGKIKPEDCREHIEQNFSLQKMVENYEKTYRQIIDARR